MVRNHFNVSDTVHFKNYNYLCTPVKKELIMIKITFPDGSAKRITRKS